MKQYALIAMLLAGITAIACGPSFPNEYFIFGKEERVIQSPRMPHATSEIENRYKKSEPQQHRRPWNRQPRGTWKTTLDADAATLKEAMAGQPDSESTITTYVEFREAYRVHYEEQHRKHWWKSTKPPIERFDSAPYVALLDTLPIEFALYARGAEAFRAEEYAEAAEFWRRILELPVDSRKYRSVWAEFMLGRAKLKLNEDDAIQHFVRVRELAENNFPDPLNLAASSLGWQAQAAFREKRFIDAAHLYERQLESNAVDHSASALSSLRYLGKVATWHRPINLSLLEDPLMADLIVTTIRQGHDYAIEGERWTITLADVDHALMEHDFMVTAAASDYRTGNYASATNVLANYTGESIYASWLRAKLAVREGDLDTALEQYRIVTMNAEDQNLARAQSELGVLELGRGAYTEALDLFRRSGWRREAAYVAYSLLTINELESYVVDNDLSPDEESQAYSHSFAIPSIHQILASRLAENEDWERALRYYATSERTVVESFLEWRSKALDTSLSEQERADAYWNAANVLYTNGMSILTAHPQYNTQFRFGFYSIQRDQNSRLAWESERAVTPELTLLDATENEIDRLKKRIEDQSDGNVTHYRSAALMWEAAKLSEDNTAYTARALWEGGDVLKYSDPQAADRFYKALVNRCRQLPIGQEADKRRWFPKTPPPLPEGMPALND